MEYTLLDLNHSSVSFSELFKKHCGPPMCKSLSTKLSCQYPSPLVDWYPSNCFISANSCISSFIYIYPPNNINLLDGVLSFRYTWKCLCSQVCLLSNTPFIIKNQVLMSPNLRKLVLIFIFPVCLVFPSVIMIIPKQ